MNLLRASCPCGYATRKARSGYHYDKWWFPLFSTDKGTLTDVVAALPIEDRKRINQQQIDLYRETPRDDKLARREASVKMNAIDDEIHKTFIECETTILRDRYASDEAHIFDPPLHSTLRCPECGNQSLFLDQVRVIAICKADCRHEYHWPDSEEHGCPKCDYRPHTFRTETEERYSDQPRTVCSCPCSSTTDCTSHVDGYCPKCGSLADAYRVNSNVFCGIHHEKMLPYNAPSNFLFILPHAPTDEFPNAKFWGDASDESDSVAGSYCVTCETGHQRWLELHAEKDG